MNATLIAKLFIVQYIVLVCAYLYEQDFARALYWTGAAIIVTATLMMR